MTTTSEYLTRFTRAISKGERGFPGPPGPVSGGVYPSAGVPLSTGSAWGTSYATTGSGSVVLSSGGTLTGTLTVGSSVVVPNGGTIGQAAGPLLTFDDTNNYLEITGCKVGIETTTPQNLLHIYRGTGDGYDLRIGYTTGYNLKLGYFVGSEYGAIQAYGADESTYDDIAVNPLGGKVGVGTVAPNAKIESLSTTEQLRLSYDASHYTSFTVGATGAMEIKPVAGAGVEIELSGTGDFNLNDGFNLYNLHYDTNTRSFGVNILPTNANFEVGGTMYVSGDVELNADNKHKDFTSGFGGTNWQITDSGNAEFGNVLVRGGFSVYELIINRMHYQNGGLIIGPGAGKIGENSIVDKTQGAEVIIFEDPNGAAVVPVAAHSIILIQNVDINRSTVVKKIVREVDSIAGTQVTFKATAGWVPAVDDVGIMEAGDEACVIGDTTTAALQNSIFFTATETNNPYMAVFTEVNSYSDWLANARLKVMVGNLAKIASATYGDLVMPASPGYGFFSDNCYLSGKIVSTSGKIGGFTISADQLAATNGDSYISYIDADGVFSWARMNSYCYSQQSTPVTLTANPYYVVALDNDSESTLNLPASGLPGSGQSTSMVIIHAYGTGLGAGKYHIQGNGHNINKGGVHAASFDLDEGKAVLLVWDPRQSGQWYAIG